MRKLLNKLPVKSKLLLILILPMLLIVILGSLMLSNNLQEYQASSQVASLTKVGVSASRLVHELQKERGLTAGFIGSQGQKLSRELASQRNLTNDAKAKYLKVVSEFPKDNDSAVFHQKTQDIKSSLARLDEIRRNVSSLNITLSHAISYYTNQNALMLSLFDQIVSAGNSLDISNRASAYVYFLQSKEKSGIERAVLSGVFAQDKYTGQLKNKLIALIADQNTFKEAFTKFAKPEHINFEKQTVQGKAVETVEQLRELALSKNEGFATEPGHWFSMATERINLLKKVEDYLADDLLNQSSVNQNKSLSSLLTLLVSMALVFVLTIVLAVSIIRSILSQLNNLHDVMNDIEKNADLSIRASQLTKDELGLVTVSFNNMLDNLSSLVSGVRSATQLLNGSIDSVQDATNTVYSQTDEGIIQTEMVATAVQEMEASISEVAQNSKEAATLAATSNVSIEQGKDVAKGAESIMNTLVNDIDDSMTVVSKLAKDTDQIGNVLDVIRGVAEQTNLLALNAAIEAARAGEQGRGFAVVADEVRSLAQKTQESTQQISEVIEQLQLSSRTAVSNMEDSQKSANDTLKEFKAVTDLFETIMSQSNEINNMNLQTATATEQQQNTVVEINKNIIEIKNKYQLSANSVESLNSASSTLGDVANDMDVQIRHFTV